MLSSINIACGGHAGDVDSMRDAVALGLRHGLALGAHPSYPDPEGFGRASMAIAPEALADAIAQQVAAIAAIAAAHGVPIRHVKPHGALYNDAARDTVVAAAIADGVARVTRDVALVALAE